MSRVFIVCEAAEAGWGEELCTLIQQAAAAMVQSAAQHQRREAEVNMRTRGTTQLARQGP